MWYSLDKIPYPHASHNGIIGLDNGEKIPLWRIWFENIPKYAIGCTNKQEKGKPWHR
jgi:hypothetical protein